ncbi:MAG: hypothetical protein SPD93_06445 [Lachnospiraceae bacterium]|nr:hypothetical protein [Lachnospiraceae bacterium]
MKRRKYAVAALIMCGAAICLFLFVMKMKNSYERVPEDPVDRASLRTAGELKAENPDIRLAVETLPVSRDTKSIAFILENRTDAGISYQNGIMIDRLTEDGWYYWGSAGNSYEIGYGVEAQGKERIAFALAGSVLGDGDYLETYDGETLFADGKTLEGNPKAKVILYPGRYRARIQVAVDSDSQTEAYEAVCEFTSVEQKSDDLD